MKRTLKDLPEQQQRFIDAVYIQMKTYQQATELLGVNLATIREWNKTLEPVWRPLIVIRNKWKAKQAGSNFWDFCHWYQTAERICRYCGITETELEELHAQGINNKRPTRGRTLEIDRKIANELYTNLSNLTWCCYWCNNAKTDTFTEAEFEVIGKAIGKVWKQRLGK